MAFSMGLATSQQPHARSHWLRPRSQTCHPEPREGTQSLSVTKLALKPVPRLSLCVYHACYWPAPVRPRAHTHAYKSEWAGSAPPALLSSQGWGPRVTARRSLLDKAEIGILMCILRFGKVGNQFTLGRKNLDW